jgi:Putative Flp pilus-assembly TadE/G-like
MRIHRDERGQTLILVALSLPLLIGFVGIATDVGALFKDKRTLQTAADAAAIAGALNYNYGSTAWKAAAKAASAANGFTDGSNGVIVKTPTMPTWPSSNYYNKSGYIEVTITKPEPTIFLALFGFSSVTVQARAVAGLGPGSTCVYTVGSTGNDVNVSNGANLAFTGCGLLDDSDSANALTVSGGGKLTAGSIGIVSSSWTSGEVNNGGEVTPSPSNPIVPASDPLSYLTAPSYSTAGCNAGTTINTSGTFNPASAGGVACYNGITIGGGATVTIDNPGVFVINGGLTIANGASVTLGSGLYYITGIFSGQGGSTISGSAVTFYMAGTAAQINIANGVNLNLTAPNNADSTYNGMLFWQASNDAQPITIAGGANSTLEGAVYAPDAQLNVSNGTSTNIYLDLVVDSLTSTGGSSIKSYESLPGVAPVLTAASLVE